jgi:hypothetical protein
MKGCLMRYDKHEDIILARETGYCRFWGRDTDEVAHQTDDAIPHIDVFRFPVVNDPESTLNDLTIYITGGMSDVPMPAMDISNQHLRHAEITAYAYEPMYTESGKSDFIAWLCHWMAHYPFDNNTYFARGQTFDWGKPIIPGSKMEGFYFAKPPFVDYEMLMKVSITAKAFIHLVPISRPEMEYALSNCPGALLDLFGKKEVMPIFDLNRKCSMSKR